MNIQFENNQLDVIVAYSLEECVARLNKYSEDPSDFLRYSAKTVAHTLARDDGVVDFRFVRVGRFIEILAIEGSLKKLHDHKTQLVARLIVWNFWNIMAVLVTFLVGLWLWKVEPDGEPIVATIVVLIVYVIEFFWIKSQRNKLIAGFQGVFEP